jgi:hypothetical protein
MRFGFATVCLAITVLSMGVAAQNPEAESGQAVSARQDAAQEVRVRARRTLFLVPLWT